MENDPFVRMLVNRLANDPRVANNPQAQEYLRIIQSGDAQRGEQIARNLCETYGTNCQDAVAQAKAFFHLGG